MSGFEAAHLAECWSATARHCARVKWLQTLPLERLALRLFRRLCPRAVYIAGCEAQAAGMDAFAAVMTLRLETEDTPTPVSPPSRLAVLPTVELDPRLFDE